MLKNFFKFKWATRADKHMNREIIVNAEKLETRVAVLENEIGRASCRERV